MALLGRRLIHMLAFAAAAISLGRGTSPVHIEACAGCETPKSCKGGLYTGSGGCTIPEGADCVGTGGLCGPS